MFRIITDISSNGKTGINKEPKTMPELIDFYSRHLNGIYSFIILLAQEG